MAEKPSYRGSWRKRNRCLFPIQGFYEWQEIEGQKQKQRWFILIVAVTIWTPLLQFVSLQVAKLGTDKMTELPRGKERRIIELLFEHGELYGLELVKLSDGILKRGTVYVSLGRLEDKGFVRARKQAPPKRMGGPPRRIFSLSGQGEHAARAYLTWSGTEVPA